jgi:hypothetical protein
LVVPDFTVMSTMPAVCRPYWAGNAPVAATSGRHSGRVVEQRQTFGQLRHRAGIAFAVVAAHVDLAETVLPRRARSSTWFRGAFSPCGRSDHAVAEIVIRRRGSAGSSF